MRTPTATLPLSAEQRAVLLSIAKSQTAPHREVRRAKALLLAADGMATYRIAAEIGASPASVTTWRARFTEEGVPDLGKVRKGRGRKPTIPQDKVEEIVRATTTTTPPASTQWSTRTMAEAQGVGATTIQRIWSSRKLQPHRVDPFNVSTDPHFEEQLMDVVGLHLNPSDRAVVLRVDEESRAALARGVLSLISGSQQNAYFGRPRTRRPASREQEIRKGVRLKKKLVKAFRWESFQDPVRTAVLIRDIGDEDYPNFVDAPDFLRTKPEPWHMAAVLRCSHEGLMICRMTAEGWCMPDGSWDVLQDTLRDMSLGGFHYEYRNSLGLDVPPLNGTEEAWEAFGAVNPGERVDIDFVQLLPYESIREVDEVGDLVSKAPHLFCTFAGESGPYSPDWRTFGTTKGAHVTHELLRSDRRGLFPEDLAGTSTLLELVTRVQLAISDGAYFAELATLFRTEMAAQFTGFGHP
jgi:transposase